jgi:hypothetical protein
MAGTILVFMPGLWAAPRGRAITPEVMSGARPAA